VILDSCTSISKDSAPLDNEEIKFYIKNMPDREFVDVYGDDQKHKTCYTAAEERGQIGVDSIQVLVKRLYTDRAYGLMLVVYGLLLDSQDAQVMDTTQDHYLQLDVVLTPDTNLQNRQSALNWCQR